MQEEILWRIYYTSKAIATILVPNWLQYTGHICHFAVVANYGCE